MGILQKVLRNCLWQLLSFLPKDQKKAVCQSYYGRGYSDSPRAIAEELRKRGWKVYWIVNGPEAACTLPEGVIPLKIDSPKAIYHQCTAGVWVDNARKWAYTQKRGRTCYIQTWHGFPLKRIEGDVEDALPTDYMQAAKKDSAMADLFLSDSRFLSDIYRRAFWYSGEILECGFPRNDILFGEHPEIKEKARRALDIPPEKKLMLYAPTFRKDKGLEVYDVDYARCVEALKKRFGGEWLILAKLHPNIADKAGELGLDPRYVRNASDYPDIQELYLLCDAMLTDYSSVMFDYMNTGRPCFAYVNDLAAYKDDRNFYFDIDKLPFSRSETNDELVSNILVFDEETQQAKMQQFRREFGMVENAGNAAGTTIDYLEQRRNFS
ncbi:MAG: CDP-glycerol glycerophosphotransferase family protein [Acutalibacter sp.]|nr:CDP-glycerol glycerophosphotransferase family protein [Acutalibacter sp.]